MLTLCLALELSLAADVMILVIAGGILWLLVYAILEHRKPNEVIVDADPAGITRDRWYEVEVVRAAGAESEWIRLQAASKQDAIRIAARRGEVAMDARPVDA